MSKKRIGISIAVFAALALAFILYTLIFPANYVPADDEIALHIQLDTKEDLACWFMIIPQTDMPIAAVLQM